MIIERKDVLKNIIEMADVFYSDDHNMSIYDIAKSTGYVELVDKICENELKIELKKHESVDNWMLYSEDKKNCGGWYIVRKFYLWRVGLYDGGTTVKEYIFTNKYRAMAFFILKELNSVLFRT